MNIKMKIWLEKDGQNFMGEGRIVLLRAIEETGSINGASEKLKISFRHAWGQIKKLEKRLGIRLIEPQVGGKGGGGSKLTKEAKDLLAEFEAVSEDLHSYLEVRQSKTKLLKKL